MVGGRRIGAIGHTLLSVCSIVAPLSAQTAVTAFVDVTVIPMDRERVLARQTVLVRGDRIVALGPAQQVSVPTGAARIDGRGKYLMPGLADMHAHVPGVIGLVRAMQRAGGDAFATVFSDEERLEAERMLFLYAAAGVTTVRIMHGGPDVLALRARAAAGELVSPRIYTSTPMLVPTESAADIAAMAKAAGYDLLKTYGMSGVLLDSLVAGARRVGIPIAGHAPEGDHAFEAAIRAGYTSIEHLTGFNGTWLLPDRAIDTMDLRRSAEALSQARVWSCPTQMVNGFNVGYFTADTLADWPEMRYVTDTALQQWKERWNVPESTHRSLGERPRKGIQWMNVYRQMIKALHDAGAGLLLGTDASVPGIMPGFAAHRELDELVKAGLTPYEALATGTRNVAAYFGTLDSTGTIAIGKRADLVLLAGNPLTDIHQTTRRAGVMLGGRWFSQKEIERQLTALRGALF